MYVSEQEIKGIVRKVVSRIAVNKQLVASAQVDVAYTPTTATPGIFASMEEAIAAAVCAQRQLMELSIDTRGECISCIRENGLGEVLRLARLAVAETGMGRAEDKVEKNKLAILKTPGIEDLSTETFSGDRGLTIQEMAPYGVIGSISPSTNPSETVFSNSIGMIAAGNAVVFNPHPVAKRVSQLAVEIINRSVMEAGGPENLVTTVLEPTLETGKVLFTHPGIRLLCVTGGPAVVAEALKTNKKVIAAGPGNPPVVVDETADIAHAAEAIVSGAALDNNVLCIAEKEIIVVASVAEALKTALKRHHAYELNAEQMAQLMEKIVTDWNPGGGEPVVNRDLIGRNAGVIAQAIGLRVPSETRLLFAQVPNDHELIFIEQLMPVMPLTVVPDVNAAIELAYKAERNYFHTAMMHSLNVANMTKMARVMNVSIFVKNGPSYAGLGFGGEGYTTFTIASPTGEGLTRARTFTRQRRCSLIDYLRII